MSDQMLVQYCAPTLAGLKTANLFSCAYESEDKLLDALRRLNRQLGGKGLRVLPLRRRGGRALIYVYRPSFLARDLRRGGACELLRDRGYCCEDPAQCLRHLKRRLADSGDFPHEIGLFLGYPPEDVCGFMADRRGCKCIGCWKVYGNEQAARACFDRFERCTKTLCDRFERGMSLDNLAVAV